MSSDTITVTCQDCEKAEAEGVDAPLHVCLPLLLKSMFDSPPFMIVLATQVARMMKVTHGKPEYPKPPEPEEHKEIPLEMPEPPRVPACKGCGTPFQDEKTICRRKGCGMRDVVQ